MSQYTGLLTQSRSTIRTRLVIAFLAIVLMPMIVLGVVLAISNTQTAQQQITSELKLLASSQQTQMNSLVFELKTELNQLLAGEAETGRIVTMMNISPGSVTYQASYDYAHQALTDYLKVETRFDEINIVASDGLIVTSSNTPLEGTSISDQTYFRNGLEAPGISGFIIDTETGAANVYIYRPIFDYSGFAIGVLVGRVNNDAIYNILDVGNRTSTTSYLVSSQFVLVSPSPVGTIGTRIDTKGALAALKGEETLQESYLDTRNMPVIGVFKRLPELNSAILLEEDLTEIQKSSVVLIAINVSLGLAALIIAIVASLLVTRGISTPLADLADTATRIASGETTLEADTTRTDEIGQLSEAFNSMTAQLNGLINSLENRVQERTRDLENRSRYLDATAEVSRAIGTILEFEPLARQVVEMIRSNFNLYYVGLFLLNEEGDVALLKAGTGTAGEVMLGRGHSIRVGTGMVGWSIENNKARVAGEAGQDVIRLATSELPHTRAEAALPLHSRGRVIGALTVQSEQEGVFDEMYISVLQIMADHVATALENARLFDQSRANLEAIRKAYGESTHAAWTAITRRQALTYRANRTGVSQVREAILEAETSSSPGLLRLPIVVRGQELGVIEARKPEDQSYWTREETSMLETLVDQLSVALDNARLYNDTQLRAERERLISDITAKVRASTNLDVILQTSITELAQALRTPKGTILIRGTYNQGQGGAANE